MITRGVKDLVQAAEAEIESWPAAEALRHLNDPDVRFVDLRDVRELWREGTIPGAAHAPRGMLEFWVDPASPYARPLFQENKRFVFFCASGWRSALATKAVQDMGLAPVCHIAGGFSAWKEAGGPVAAVERK
jgi:rhodanese-related sulfurtransferase